MAPAALLAARCTEAALLEPAGPAVERLAVVRCKAVARRCTARRVE